MATNNNSKKKNTQTRSSNTKPSGRSASNTTQRRTSGSRNNSQRSKSQSFINEPLDVEARNEIILIVVLAICILLFLCNLGLIGAFGKLVSNAMFGIFGAIAYILPVCVIVFTLFRIFNRNNSIVTRKLAASVVLFLLVMIVCDLIVGGINIDNPFSLSEVYSRCNDGNKGHGGGVIGGFIAYHCVKAFSRVGAWLLVLVLACICVIAIAGRSLLSGIKEQGQMLYEDSREEGRYRRERSIERREEKRAEREEKIARKREINDELERERRLKKEARENEQILRMDKKASGVSFDTKLSGDVSEAASEKEVEFRDDEHIIRITGIDEYEKKVDNSVLIHENTTSDGSDATREITFEYDEDIEETYDEISQPIESSNDRQVDAETTYQAPIHMNGKTYEVDQSAYGAGANKPEASYSTEYGNTMGHTSGRKRPIATAQSDSAQDKPEAPKKKSNPSAVYKFPPVDLLTKGQGKGTGDAERELRETADKLQKTLEVFGVSVKITDISRGPAVTRYEMQPELGVKVSKIVGLSDDLKLALAATDIRIEAPIPGKSAVGIEIPNKENEAVAFRSLIESKEFKSSTAALPFAVGKDLAGQIIVHDIAKMPHVLIAGATGSGKSVCINTIIMSILYKCKPEDVKLIMIDPKVVELSVYNGIPHLLLPVVTDPKKAAGALGWAVKEMMDRYAKFADAGVRDLKGYNSQITDASEKLPHILIIVDELADLMMVAPGEVEEHICRLAQLARACGIHVVIATQRPSVDVITGLIKANMPSRIAFAVSSGVDSRTILDMVGAEKLLGKGDMLFYPQGLPKPSRVQGAFVPDSDVSKVVEFLKNLEYVPSNDQDIAEAVNHVAQNGGQVTGTGTSDGGSDYDPLFAEAGRFIIDKEKASIGALQRLLKIGFNRAARIMDQLASEGVVGEEQGTKPREILMDQDEFENLLESLGIN